MIYLALGANLSGPFGAPLKTLQAAKTRLEAEGISIQAHSSTWLTAPVPFDPAQDWYHNEVIAVQTDLSAEDLMHKILEIEAAFGRERSVKNAPRLIDIDLIAYHDAVVTQGDFLIVPHPRMQDRLFVLKPLAEIAQDWIHPQSGKDIATMMAPLIGSQQIKKLEGKAA